MKKNMSTLFKCFYMQRRSYGCLSLYTYIYGTRISGLYKGLF